MHDTLAESSMGSASQLARRCVITATLSLLGCSSPFESFGDIRIRVANNSSFAFDRVEVVFPEDAIDYGSIRAGDVSQYANVSAAYRYAYIEVEIDGEELKIQPIDYVGETPLEAGRYTYALNVTIEGYLTLELREDR